MKAENTVDFQIKTVGMRLAGCIIPMLLNLI